ncbi:MAG: AAA family ATPase [Mycoplasmataceae bacterium]|nr:AAA family ATPase [Mycoplasmataceae bacterium]
MKIIISGTSGVGKSTTVTELEKRLKKQGKKVSVIGELVVENPYFELFFNDLPGWGFLAQIDFLMQRFRQWVEIEKNFQNDDEHVIIYDRHFLEDIIFSELKKVKDAYSIHLQSTYKILYHELLRKVEEFEEFEKPDFFIMLKASFDIVMERQFNHRSRDLEDNFNTKYWQDLYYRYYGKASYKNIFKNYNKNFVVIDTDDSNPTEVVDSIIKYINKRMK